MFNIDKFGLNNETEASQEKGRKKLRIAWKINSGERAGETGHGEFTDMSDETALDWLDSLKEEHPEMEHWVEYEDEK